MWKLNKSESNEVFLALTLKKIIERNIPNTHKGLDSFEIEVMQQYVDKVKEKFPELVN